MQRSRTLLGVIAGAAALLVVAGASTAGAAPPAPAGTAVPTTATLPLFGAQLTVEVSTGPGGALTSVTVNPADGLTATTLRPNRVVFENVDGTGTVSVGTDHGSQKVEARGGALADVSGPGSWSGDVFDTGTATTVSFTVGATAEGGPDITGVTSSDAGAVVNPTEYWEHDGHHGSLRAAFAKVTFSAPGQTRSLYIKVAVEADDDDSHAKVSVSLGRIHGTPLPVADAIGEKTWTGQLCDGTTASITYTVNEDGTLTLGAASPEGAETRAEGGHIQVQFAGGEAVKIGAWLGEDGITVNVWQWIRCKDAPDPTVNTPVDPSAGDDRDGDGDCDGDHDDHDDHDGKGDDRGGHDGDHDGDHDDGDHDGSWGGGSGWGGSGDDGGDHHRRG